MALRTTGLRDVVSGEGATVTCPCRKILGELCRDEDIAYDYPAEITAARQTLAKPCGCVVLSKEDALNLDALIRGLCRTRYDAADAAPGLALLRKRSAE
jgi:hypothetical protein